MASGGHGQELPHLLVRCRVGCSAHPLRVMDRNGTCPACWTAMGRGYYTEVDALRFPGEGNEAPKGVTVVYCRMSRRGRQADLERQVAAMEMYCLGASVAVDEWRSEIGGGPDFKRKEFLSLRKRMEARAIARQLIAHRDRLSRFGFDWFEHFARPHGCTLPVVNPASLSPRAEMVEDLMAVVHTFSGCLHGLRACHKQIQEAANDG